MLQPPEFTLKNCLMHIYFCHFTYAQLEDQYHFVIWTWHCFSVLSTIWTDLWPIYGSQPLVESIWMHKYMLYSTVRNTMSTFNSEANTVAHDTWMYTHTHSSLTDNILAPFGKGSIRVDWEHFKQALILRSQEAVATHTSPV